MPWLVPSWTVGSVGVCTAVEEVIVTEKEKKIVQYTLISIGRVNRIEAKCLISNS